VSDDNVAVVRRFWSSPLDSLPHVIDADVDYRAIEGAPDDVGVMHGRDEMVRYLVDWTETFADFSVQLEEVEVAGEDLVVALGRVSGQARASGVETELRVAVLYTVRDGRIVRGREYMTKDEALAAAAQVDAPDSTT
jgi:ketosteroid isomerase-like protein